MDDLSKMASLMGQKSRKNLKERLGSPEAISEYFSKIRMAGVKKNKSKKTSK